MAHHLETFLEFLLLLAIITLSPGCKPTLVEFMNSFHPGGRLDPDLASKEDCKQLDLRVTSKLGTFTLVLPRSATGKDVFDRIVRAVGIQEFWYFGLSCVDKVGDFAWLDLNRKILDQNIRKKEPLQLRLTLKYYPASVDKVVLNITKRLLYLHMRDVIVSESVYCPPEVSLVLASYCAQEQYGDYNPSMHLVGSLLSSDFLPARIFLQFKTNDLSLEAILFQLYERRRGITREEAISTYLSICQSLAMYGARHFQVTMPQGNIVYMTVDSFGIRFFTTDNPLEPKTAFSLNELRGIKYVRNRVEFIVGMDTLQTFVFFTIDAALAKRVYLRCLGYRDLYIRGLSNDPNLLRYITEGAAHTMFNDLSTESRTSEAVTLEMAQIEATVTARLKNYDSDRRAICGQLAVAGQEAQAVEQEMTQVHVAQAKTLSQQHATVRAKGFYDYHTTLSAATIPALARDHYQMRKETQRLSAQAARGSHLLEQLRQATAQARTKEKQLRRQAEVGFTTLNELHVFDNGVSENEICLAKEMEFPVIAMEDRRQPWAGLTSFIHTHPDTKHEVSRISAELNTLIISANQTVVDIHDRRSVEQGAEKFSTIRNLMAAPIKDRIRLLDII